MSNRFPLLSILASDVAHEDLDESPYPLDDIIDHAASLSPGENRKLAAECRVMSSLNGDALASALNEVQWVWDMEDDAETASMFGHFSDLFEGVAEELSAG